MRLRESAIGVPQVNEFADFGNSAELKLFTKQWGPPKLLQNYTVTSDTFAALKLIQHFEHYGVTLGFGSTADLSAYAGKEVVLGIRPEDLEDAALATSTPADQRLKGTTELTEALGSEIMVHFSIAAKPAVTDDVRELAEDVGDDRGVEELAQTDTATLVGRFGPPL